jgi:hypothetical protein
MDLRTQVVEADDLDQVVLQTSDGRKIASVFLHRLGPAISTITVYLHPSSGYRGAAPSVIYEGVTKPSVFKERS